MYVSDTSDGLDSDFFSWDTVTPNHSDLTSGTISPPKDAIFNAMTLSSSGNKQPRTLAPNLTRRSHKKSRAGCFTCKSRKIKCGEQKPKCGNCLLKSLDCVYPPTEQTKRKETPAIALTKRNVGGVTGSPATASFTMLDMRFFHHFLTTAYPHLPIGNDHVWVNEIPQFAESHEYLMHAILSLGASHLSRLTDMDYRKESLIHRGQAIAGLNTALSMPARHYGESDAMLAACYALTFQASYMGDGLADFITMVRGCALTTAKIKQEDVPTAFNLQPNWHFKVMAPRLASLPRVNHLLLQSGIAALEDIRPFLDDEVDMNFHQALIEVLEALLDSPQGGYLQFAGLYAVWYELCHDSFKRFLDPHNLPAQLLLAYFVGLQMLMVPLAVYEWPDRADSAKSRVLSGTVEWATGIFTRLEDAGSPLRTHLGWPRRIMAIVAREIAGEWSGGGGGGDGGSGGAGAGLGTGAGVSVLRLDLPISPPLTTTGVDGGGDSLGEVSVSVSEDGDRDVDVGELDWAAARFWEDEVGGDLVVGSVVDPVLVTTMGVENVVSGATAPAVMETIDLDMDFL